MQYIDYLPKTCAEVENLKPYLTKSFKNGRVLEFRFDDASYNDYIRRLNLDSWLVYGEEYGVLGTDGYFYSLTPIGAVRGKKCPPGFPAKVVKGQANALPKCMSDLKYKNRMLAAYASGGTCIVKNGPGLLGFERCVYVVPKENVVIPFRLKKAKKANRPFVVYFAGGGTVGHDNFRPMSEFLGSARGAAVLRRDCNVLVPQALWCTAKTQAVWHETFVQNTTALLRRLIAASAADKSRVYVYGTSFGGECVWNMVCNVPELLAGAVETMGTYCGYKPFCKETFEPVKHLPIWMAHAADDVVVPIDSDDRFYEMLQSLGAPVRYTRRETGGHKMFYSFYHHEPWLEWMFAQKRSE